MPTVGNPVGARGLLMPRQAVVHHVTLRDDMVRVQVDSVFRGFEDEPVPYPPHEEATTLRECMNSYVIWPRRLVVLGTEPSPSPSPSPRLGPSPPARRLTSPSPLGASPGVADYEPAYHDYSPALDCSDNNADQNPPSPPRPQEASKPAIPRPLPRRPSSAPAPLEPLPSAPSGMQVPQTTDNSDFLRRRRKNKRGTGGKASKDSSKGGKGSSSTGRKETTVKEIIGNWEERPDILEMPTHPVAGDRLADGSYYVDRRFSQFLLFHPQKPMVTQEDLYSLPRELQELHEYYMNLVSSGVDVTDLEIRVRVPKHYGYFDSNAGEIQDKDDISFGVDFLDLFHLFNRKSLDNAILRLWCVHYTREAFRLKEYGMAVADPLLFNATLLGPDPHFNENRKTAIHYLTRFMLKNRDRRYILLFYHLR